MLHEIIRQTRTTMKEMRNKKSHNIAKLKNATITTLQYLLQ